MIQLEEPMIIKKIALLLYELHLYSRWNWQNIIPNIVLDNLDYCYSDLDYPDL